MLHQWYSLGGELERMGLHQVQLQGDTLTAKARSVQVFTQLRGAALRLEVRLLGGVTRNKLSLWNTIHLNNSWLPFGQFYISPDRYVCLGCSIPQQHMYDGHLARIAWALITCAEGYLRLVMNDYQELDFTDRTAPVQMLNLQRTDLRPPTGIDMADGPASLALLERLLAAALKKSEVYATGNNELEVAGDDCVTSFRLEEMPYSRRTPGSPGWLLGMRTEVGVLQTTDNNLWVYLNALNYQGYMLTHSIKFVQQKPFVILQTELATDLLQHPEVVLRMLTEHQQHAASLLQVLKPAYKIQDLLSYRLGI